MTDFGANEDEMRIFSKLSERQLDAVLAGKATGGEYDDVATFFQELRRDVDRTLPAETESRHLAKIFEASRHDEPTAVSAPLTVAPRGARTLHNPFRRLAARATIAAVALAALAAFGGAAYAGALPAPVQTKVADIARHVGLSLPAKHHDSKPHGGDAGADVGPAAGTQSTRTPSTSTPSTNSQDAGTQGTDTQGAGTKGNETDGTQTDGTQSNENQTSTSNDAQQQYGGSRGTDSQGNRTTRRSHSGPSGDQGVQTTGTVQIAPSPGRTQGTQDGQSSSSGDAGGGSSQQPNGGNGAN